MTFSPTDAAFEGFRLARREPMTMVWWSLAYLVFMAAIFLAVGGPMIAFMSQAEALGQGGGTPSDAQMQTMVQSYLAFAAIILPLALVFGSVLSAAVARSVIRPGDKAIGYLRLGIDELRVLVVSVVLTIVIGLVAALAFGIVGAIAGFAVAGDMPALWIVVVLVGIAALGLLVWVSVRLSLAVPIIVAEKRWAFFDSFALTKGNSLRLLGMAILAFVMAMLVSLLLGIVSIPLTLLTGGAMNWSSVEGQSPVTMLQTAAPALIVMGVVQAIQSALQAALLYAPFSAAYLGIKGRTPGDAAEVFS